MATFMDVSLFSYFRPIFLFLLVFVVVYSFLAITKTFEKVPGKNGIFSIIALAVAFFVLMFQPATSILYTLIPWFTVLIILVFLVMFVFKMFNQDDKMWENVIKQKAVMWTLLTLVMLIILVSLSSTFGQTLLSEQQEVGNGIITETTVIETTEVVVDDKSTSTDDFGNNLLMTLIHPKVLGLILMMIIGLFTIMLLSDSQAAKF